MALRDPNRMFDVRTVKRNIRSGRTTREQYQEFLSGQPDVADNIMEPDEGGDADGYDEKPAEGEEAAAAGEGAAQAPTGEGAAQAPAAADPSQAAPAVPTQAPTPGG